MTVGHVFPSARAFDTPSRRPRPPRPHPRRRRNAHYRYRRACSRRARGRRRRRRLGSDELEPASREGIETPTSSASPERAAFFWQGRNDHTCRSRRDDREADERFAGLERSSGTRRATTRWGSSANIQAGLQRARVRSSAARPITGLDSMNLWMSRARVGFEAAPGVESCVNDLPRGEHDHRRGNLKTARRRCAATGSVIDQAGQLRACRQRRGLSSRPGMPLAHSRPDRWPGDGLAGGLLTATRSHVEIRSTSRQRRAAATWSCVWSVRDRGFGKVRRSSG